MKCDAGVRRGELPIDAEFHGITCRFPSGDFEIKGRHRGEGAGGTIVTPQRPAQKHLVGRSDFWSAVSLQVTVGRIVDLPDSITMRAEDGFDAVPEEKL